jgi:hypothetical protein
MLDLFRPLQQYVGCSISTVGASYLIIFLDRVLTFYLEFVYLALVERDVFTMMDFSILLLKTKVRGFSLQANYTDRATAACRRS